MVRPVNLKFSEQDALSVPALGMEVPVVLPGAAPRLNRRAQLNVFDLKNFGARGDGVTDDSVALQAAMTVCSAGRMRLTVSPGTYKLGTKVSLPDGGFLDLEIQPGATFDFRSLTTLPTRGACITVGTDTGGLTLLPGLSVNAVKNASSVTLLSAPTLSVGDLVIIHDTTDSSFNPGVIGRVYYRNGEYKRVHSIVGNVVRFDEPLYDGYTAGTNIVLYRVVTSSVRITGGGSLIYPGNANDDVGIQLCNVHGGLIQGISTVGAKFAHINAWRCYDTTIRDVRAETFDDDGNGSAGVYILSSHNTWVRGGSHQGSKHGVSLTGGAVMASIPNRLCGAENALLRGELTAADMHGHCDRCQWLNCTIEGGASIGGSNCAIMGGSVRSASDAYAVGTLKGLCIRVREVKNCSHTVRGVDCYVDHLSAQNGGDNPFSFQMYEAIEGGTMVVENLHIKSTVYNIKLGYLGAVGRAVTFAKPSFVWRNNHHEGVAGQKEAKLTIEGLDDGGLAAFESVLISGGSGLSPQTTNVRCKELTYENFDTQGSDTFGCVAAVVAYASNTQFINVINVRSQLNDEAGILIAAAASSDDVYATVRGCKSINNGQDAAASSASKSSLRALNLKSLELSGNTWGDTQAVQTQGILYSVTASTTLLGSGSRAIGATLLRSVSVTNDREELTFVGTGSPEGVVTAPVGAIFRRTDGGATTTLYVKTSGVGNTGWTAK